MESALVMVRLGIPIEQVSAALDLSVEAIAAAERRNER
jgi:hypothetical protein